MPSSHSHTWRTAICAASLIPRGRERARRERARRQQRDHDDCREHSKPEVTGIAGSTNVPATGIGARHDRHPTAHSQKRHRWDTAGTRHGAAPQRKAAPHSQPAERTRRGVTRQVAPSGRTGAARRQHGRPAPRASGRRGHAPAVKRSPRNRLRSGFRTKDRSHARARSGHSGTRQSRKPREPKEGQGFGVQRRLELDGRATRCSPSCASPGSPGQTSSLSAVAEFDGGRSARPRCRVRRGACLGRSEPC
jgi:hypothetical protein